MHALACTKFPLLVLSPGAGPVWVKASSHPPPCRRNPLYQALAWGGLPWRHEWGSLHPRAAHFIPTSYSIKGEHTPKNQSRGDNPVRKSQRQFAGPCNFLFDVHPKNLLIRPSGAIRPLGLSCARAKGGMAPATKSETRLKGYTLPTIFLRCLWIM